jgi:hypothetical protein
VIFGCEDQEKEGAAKGKTFLGCEKKKKNYGRYSFFRLSCDYFESHFSI